MNLTPNRIEDRNKLFQKFPDSEEVKRRRDDSFVELRKKKRIDSLLKRSRTNLVNSGTFQFDANQIEQIILSLQPDLVNESISTSDKIIMLISIINSSNDFKVLDASIELLRKVVSSENNYELALIGDSNVSIKLISLLSHENTNIKFNIAWILTNLTAASTEICIKLVRQGVIDALAKLANFETLCECTQQALWALSNLAGDCKEIRDVVYATGIPQSIIRKLFTTKNIDMSSLSKMVWLLSNLLKYKPYPPGNLQKEFIELLKNLLSLPYEEILLDTLRSIAYITSKGENITEIVNTRFVPRIISLLEHESLKIKLSALEILGNLSGGDDSQINQFIEWNLIEYVYKALTIEKGSIKASSLFILSNVTTGPWDHVSKVTSHKSFKEVVRCLDELDKNIRQEALYVISNATKHYSNALTFIEPGLLEKLLNILVYGDSEMILLALNSIENIFKCAKEHNYQEVLPKFDELGGIEKLEKLQSHPNMSIYEKAHKLLNDYIGGETSQVYSHTTSFELS
jgi:Atypical Arm repeat/Importin beta binding domain/Armadillo/beta-catenin-like repeat